MKEYKFLLIAGSQHLYGEEVLKQVEKNARTIAKTLNNSSEIPCTVEFCAVVVDSASIKAAIEKANADTECAGIITWMHTFSPAKMWIAGLTALKKPMLHLNTQFLKEIPWNDIDMDYMNLNQSAHGDREFGFICARMRIARKVICGHYEDAETKERIGHWMRSAVGALESKRLKICRFGDNMRDVAVTEGDKVEAEIRLGWSVNTWGVGDLIKLVDEVTDAEIDAKMAEYTAAYDMATDNIDSVRYQAREEIAIEKFLKDGGFGAFVDTFQDLQQLRQLPGLAAQNLMKKGYGFGGEGDWKTAGLGRIIKLMASGLKGGSAFMEDYTYNYGDGKNAVLGAHMLEVDPDIAEDRPKIEVHPLGIGDREDPARLTFKTGNGKAIVATLIDMGDRFRMIVNDVAACAPYENMPKLPVARVMWEPLPDLKTSAESWIMAGGAHHTVLSYQLDAEHLRDFCTIMGIEFVHINASTTIPQLEKELIWSDTVWKMKGIK